MAYHKYENSKKEEDLAGFEELSFQTHSYRPEYASYTDARRTERARKPAERRIRAREIIENLRENAASLCGGHDRQGRPIISILASRNDELNSEKLSETLRYLTQIPSNEVQGRGFTIIVDLRGSKWKSAKPMLRTLHDSIPNKIHQVIIIKPDAFWEKRKSDAGIKKEQSNLGYETIILSSTSKLSQFADDFQLPEELAGTLPYNHDDWLQRRTAIESYIEEASSTLNEIHNFQQKMESDSLGDTISATESLISAHETKRRILNAISQPVIKRGRDLVRKIESYEPRIPQGLRHSGEPVSMETEEKSQLKETLEELIRKDDQAFRTWENRMSDLLQSRDLKDFESGFRKVVDWVMGAGESYLSSSNKIGDSIQNCEFSKRAHEDFEFAAREIITLFGRVRDLGKKMLHGNHYAAKEIQLQKDYLDKICRSFASRMSRRSDLVNGALKFHQNASHLSSLLDDLLELLCSDAIMKDDLESAETMLSTLEHKAEAVKQSYEETMRESLTLTEVLREPTTTAQGETITLNCDEEIRYIQTTLDDLTERKQRTDELCDVRRLKLQQLLQIKTCERDAEQAIAWLQQLYSGAVDTSIDVGRTSAETLHLQQEHDKVESTAKGTYDYGKQLLQASLVLRRTCRYDLTPNQEMEETLDEVWMDFSSAMAERGARLSVALMFYRSSEMLMQRIDEIRVEFLHEYLPIELAQTTVDEAVFAHEETRQSVSKEYKETVAMGKALIDRMNLLDDGSRAPHPLEECLDELDESKQSFDEVWEARDERLRNWKHGEDYGDDVREFFVWLHYKAKELKKTEWLVGENLQEAQDLMSLFKQQETDIKRKEDEFHEILWTVKQIHPEDSQNRQETMAESLEDAWKDLNSQLEGRRILLDTSLAFHHGVEEFTDQFTTAQDELSRALLVEDVTSATSLLNQYQDLRKSVLEVSMETLAKGQALLDRLRQASVHADTNNRHATKAACYSIERVLEALHLRRRQLDDLWKGRKKNLEQCVKKCKIEEEAKRLNTWLHEEAEDYLNYKDTGDSVASTQVLLDEHSKFEAATREKEEQVERLARETEKLAHADFEKAEETVVTVNKLQIDFRNLVSRLDERRKILTKTQAFYRSGHQAMEKLDEIGDRLSDDQMSVEEQRQLLGEISQASASQLREGRLLSERIGQPLQQPVVVKIYEELRSRSKALVVSLQGATEEDAEFEQVLGWIKYAAESFMDSNSEMGCTLKSAQDFLNQHQDLEAEVQELEGKVRELTSKRPDDERVQQLKRAWSTLNGQLSFRLTLGKMYYDFHRHRKTLWESLNDLESQLTSDEPKENVDASALMFARQRQTRETIITASDRLQKDARTLMEQLQKV